MIVRQNDTLICEQCYAEESRNGTALMPPANEYCMTIDSGICEHCGYAQIPSEQEDV